MMRMDPDVRAFMRNPLNLETCMRMIREHQGTAGIPPTLEAMGASVWCGMKR